jgi:DNA-binding MarR family transcriptional regulator
MTSKSPDPLYLPSPKLNQLQILKILAGDPFLTQAALSRHCGLSVAMVNNYLKDLCEAGLIEYRRKSLKNVSYHLTSLGVAQVEILESELTAEAIAGYARDKEHIRLRILSQSPKTPLRRVILCGAGHLAELAFHALEEGNVTVLAMCDDSSRIGREWCGRPVVHVSKLADIAPDAVVITGWEHTEEIWRKLKSLLKRRVPLIRLDSPPPGESGQEFEIPEHRYTLPWA